MHRRADIEVLRVLSAFGIVWYHSGAVGHDVAYSGLIVFIVMSVFLATQRAGRPTPVASRASRLLVPWALWFFVYMGANWCMEDWPVPLGLGWLAGILTGSSIHLWYLPFIFAVLVTCDAVSARLPPAAMALAAGVLAILVLATAPAWRDASLAAGPPIAQYAHAAAAVFAGAFLGLQHVLNRQLAFAVLAGIFIACLIDIPIAGLGLPYVIGLALTSLVVMSGEFRFSHTAFLMTLADLTLGIYLAHVLVSLVLRKLIPALPATVLSVAVFTVSAAAVYLVRRLAPSVSRYAT